MSSFRDIIKEKSSEELSDIFIKNSGYQEAFMDQVQEELISRNIPIESLIKFRTEQNTIDIVKLEQGEQGGQFWISAGFLALFYCILDTFLFHGIGSFLAVVWPLTLGYTYAYSKKKHQEKMFFVYNESTKIYGTIMMGLAMLLLGFNLWKLFV